VAAHIGSDQPVLAVELLTARIRSGHSLKDTYDDMNFTPADLAKKNRARTLIVQGYRVFSIPSICRRRCTARSQTRHSGSFPAAPTAQFF